MQEAILGGLIGAIAAIGANWLAGRQNASLEREKWLRGIADSFATEVRKVVAQLADEVAKAAHSMCWVTWLAQKGATCVKGGDIDTYNQELHGILPRIVGLHAVLAGMDPKLHRELHEVVDMAYKIDGAIGAAGLEHAAGDAGAIDKLAAQLPEAQKLVGKLNGTLLKAMVAYTRSPA